MQPKNIIEAVNFLLTHANTLLLNESTEDEFVAIAHPSIGRKMRNEWHLWWSEYIRDSEYKNRPDMYPQEKPELVQFFNDLEIEHPDTMSGIILRAAYRQYHKRPVDLDGLIRKYKPVNFPKEPKRADNGDRGPSVTPAEAERLALLIEECAEVQQMATKILRHGYESFNPFDEARTPNRKLLEKEIGDLNFAIGFLYRKNDVDIARVVGHSNDKINRVKKYLHHNKV